jgi:hypothetical protein
MYLPKKLFISLFFMALGLTFLPASTAAKDKEFDALVRHLQSTYRAKKVKIPFMWLARFAVKIVRPAGVKSFNFTLFENLKFSGATLDEEMQAAMRNSLNPEWIPLLRIRSRGGEQMYAYMRENGNNVKLMLVTIERDQAAVIRATFDPEKLAEFINNPKIFGISLGDKKPDAKALPAPEPEAN